MKYASLALPRRRLLLPALALGAMLLAGCATTAYKEHARRGDEYMKDMNYPAAEREFREVLRLAPDNTEAHRDLGNALELQGRHGAAEKEYREAVRLAPHDSAVLSGLAYFLDRQGRRKEARPYWEKALKAEKKHDGACFIKERLAEPD
jgi:Flp pilus assembly protein TadD